MLTCIPEAFKICHQIHDLPSTAHSARVCVKGCPLSLEHAIYITCVQRSLRPGPLADELLHDELVFEAQSRSESPHSIVPPAPPTPNIDAFMAELMCEFPLCDDLQEDHELQLNQSPPADAGQTDLQASVSVVPANEEQVVPVVDASAASSADAIVSSHNEQHISVMRRVASKHGFAHIKKYSTPGKYLSIRQVYCPYVFAEFREMMKPPIFISPELVQELQDGAHNDAACFKLLAMDLSSRQQLENDMGCLDANAPLKGKAKLKASRKVHMENINMFPPWLGGGRGQCSGRGNDWIEQSQM